MEMNGVVREFLMSGISVSTANIITNPLDVIKVRLQLQNNKSQQIGFIQTAIDIVKNEGVSKLWSGIIPSIYRGFFFGGLRLGLYTPMKEIIYKYDKPSFINNIIAGSLSGGIAAGITSPIELVKTRLQAKQTDSENKTTQIIKQIIKEKGFIGLWNGSTPSIIRSIMLTASQCATYDEFKKNIQSYTLIQGMPLHLLSSMASGFISTIVTNPIDVVKTRMFMNRDKHMSPYLCIKYIYQLDGIEGFFKGWTASYIRVGPQTIIMFLVIEQLRKIKQQ